jgi:predicted dehydrogenase
MEGAETPDVFSAAFEYPGFVATWTLNYCSDYDDIWSVVYQGDNATMVVTEYGFKVYRESWTKPENHEPIYAEEARIPVETHIQNFLECIQSRQQPNAPVEAGARAVAAPHLANVAFHQRRQVKLATDMFTTL